MKLPARDIVLYVQMFAEDWEDYYEKRAELARWFSPFGDAGTLQVTEEGVGITSGGGGLEISGYAVDGLDYPGNYREGLSQLVPIVLHCADPFWQDITPSSVTYSGGGGSDTYVVPAAVPFKVGTSVMDVTQYIDYRGDADAYPVIRIYGPITNFVIRTEHDRTHGVKAGMKLDLTGTTIGPGDWYEFDLRYGVKTLKDSAGVNRIDKLTADSNLATWRLLAGSANTITARGSGITTTTAVQLTWKNAYSGI